jgi:hypothetical protein
MAMTIRNCLQAPVLVVLLGVGCDSNGPEVVGPPISTVTCRFKDAGGKFEVRGTPQIPRFIVQFDNYSGSACLERHEQLWPDRFDVKISGSRNTILFVSLTPDGFGEIHLHFVPGKKWVNYYDDKGKWLEHSTDKAFQIETKETADGGLEVKVTMPAPARSVRRLELKYWSTCW